MSCQHLRYEKSGEITFPDSWLELLGKVFAMFPFSSLPCRKVGNRAGSRM